MKKICIIGSGSWGVAIGIHAANTGNKVIMWTHSDEECAEINKNRRTKYLPNVTIPQSIKCTTSLEEAIKESEIIFHVTPSKYTRETMKKYKQYITNQPVIARGEVTFDELDMIHNKMESLLGEEGAYIDGIYFCPHHPDK